MNQISTVAVAEGEALDAVMAAAVAGLGGYAGAELGFGFGEALGAGRRSVEARFAGMIDAAFFGADTGLFTRPGEADSTVEDVAAEPTDQAAAGEALEGVGPAAVELSEALAVARDGVGRANVVGRDGLVALLDDGVGQGLEMIATIRAGLDGTTVALAAEACARGLHVAVGLSLLDWLRVRCPWLSVSEAGAVNAVVRAGGKHWGAGLLAGVVAGEVGLGRGAKVARTMTRLAPSLDAQAREEFAEIATGAAADPSISDRDLGVVCQELLERLLDEEPKEDRERAAQALRCVSRRPVGQGMTRFTVDAPTGDAALIEGVLNGPLAAPESDSESGEVDVRSWGQRAYDALVLVINRGLANPGAAPSSGRASVMITVKADPKTGRPVGAGVTALGQVLDAQQVGRFACIGDVTPIVLGEHGEPLNLGRTVRLATPGQFKALLVRDQSCTYPGCSVPGSWCDSHHLVWWCRGGGTDIGFLVLLCPRHHSLVHQKDLMATVTGSTVTWHV